MGWGNWGFNHAHEVMLAGEVVTVAQRRASNMRSLGFLRLHAHRQSRPW